MNVHLRYADQQAAEALARLQHTITYAQGGLNASVLINGGALIGLFTMVAPKADMAAKLIPAGACFSFALVLTMIGWICATVSQDHFQISCNKRSWSEEAKAFGIDQQFDDLASTLSGTRFMYAGYAAVFLSILAFVAGSMLVLRALA